MTSFGTRGYGDSIRHWGDWAAVWKEKRLSKYVYSW